MTSDTTDARRTEGQGPLVVVRDLTRIYRRAGGARGLSITALDGVSLTIPAGSIFALVGESGGGKSTLARCLALLEGPDAGEIVFAGRSHASLSRRERHRVRRRIQLIFQDPAAAINPRFSAMEAVAEPLLIQRWADRRGRRHRALELLAEVGLGEELAERLALELSGGQRQRVAVARALAAGPRLLILDEGLASLDLSIQAQMVNLLLKLRTRYALTYLVISHDLRLVGHLADEVAVMHQGRIVEHAAPRDLLHRPQHPATRALVRAMPSSGGGKRE